ncbi:NAD-dependent epimerase/dehydratase family protein [Williamsia sterculiae]|uniref:Nucleoside-diphosphate-sugar epimerase n=1 Tax=Williamsia sterculiae TaxID=1344003 RepID=A0A1N7H2R8_9NOCA|nr:NAD-dependent epimerase/dehydratase family protein [Williamsia sterculiae]SIS19116.1 Nucleoside-diphosphate-sugar epimerase [Williamsia sterculiae]
MRLFVTGGTGALGRHAVPALVGAGHDVRALARSARKAEVLRDQGAEPVSGSIVDRDALAAAFRGCDAVVNLASSIPSTTSFVRASAWDECTRVRAEGSAAIVDAALRVGVGRFIQESVVMVYRDGDDRWLDEQSAVDHYPITVGNHAAERSARRFTEAGMHGLVLRFGLFYGPGAAHSEQFVDLARRHVGFTAGRADSFQSSIYLPDATTAIVAALTAPSHLYNIVDDRPVTKRENVDALVAATGRRAWLRGPGRAAELLGTRTTSLTRSLRVSNAAFREATPWRPRFPSVRDGYADMVSATRR